MKFVIYVQIDLRMIHVESVVLDTGINGLSVQNLYSRKYKKVHVRVRFPLSLMQSMCYVMRNKILKYCFRKKSNPRPHIRAGQIYVFIKETRMTKFN